MALPKPMVGAPVNATGVIAKAPLETALPTDATMSLDPDFEMLGLVGEEGITLTPNRSKTKKKAMGGKTVRVLQDSFEETSSFTLLESSKAEVLKAIYGDDNVTITPPADPGDFPKIAIKHNETVPDEAVYVFTLKDGERRRRVVVPYGQLSQEGEVKFVHNDLISYQVSIDHYADEADQASYEYID